MEKTFYQNTMAVTFRNEISDAITEDLFETVSSGAKSFLPFAQTHRRLPYYVMKRYNQRNTPSEEYSAEKDFFTLYWPRKGIRREQILILSGREGVGKSTFLDYFFRYFLPYYHKQDFYNEIQEGPKTAWPSLWQHHIILRTNLHRIRTVEQMYENIYEYFAFQISQCLNANKKLGVRPTGLTKTIKEQKSYLQKTFEQLAKQTCKTDHGGQRRFFITLIFDNTDLMPEHLQLELLDYSISLVQEETPKRDPHDPVDTKEHNLWKIIIPIRPETYQRLIAKINPFRNKKVWTLDPVYEDDLEKTRGSLLEELIARTDRHTQDIIYLKEEEIKPPLKLTPASLAGKSLKESFVTKVADSSTEGEISVPVPAQLVYDNLVNGSARRNLILRRRLTMSRTVNRRLALTKRHPEWPDPTVSVFYFLDGLLCGESGIYKATDDDNLILNLYDLGINTTKFNPYSLLIGIHMINLLKIEAGWHDISRKLMGIGYPPSEIDHACSCLVQKGVLKLISKGEDGYNNYEIEMPIVEAYLELICQRAYTDNVAISLGRRLRLADNDVALRTDPLNYAHFTQRVSNSCAFFQYVRKAQNSIRNPDTARPLHQQDNYTFQSHLKSLRLPDIFKYAGVKYRSRIESVMKQQPLKDWLRKYGQLFDVKSHLSKLPTKYNEYVDILRMATKP